MGEDGRVYGADKDSESLDKLLEEAKSERVKNIVLIKTEDLKLDLEDESVDVVLVYDVIHYIEERRKLFDEIYRVLKKKAAYFQFIQNITDRMNLYGNWPIWIWKTS